MFGSAVAHYTYLRHAEPFDKLRTGLFQHPPSIRTDSAARTVDPETSSGLSVGDGVIDRRSAA
jgi:hypothetical protein